MHVVGMAGVCEVQGFSNTTLSYPAGRILLRVTATARSVL